ncbi:tetratricopeptide repeat protein [Streptomyces adelaidensis]|uniref:tetratricopeptide repeat protein n=1 Tax=Streptomyces adelaidensis TaxID=2796465 RepID=UPI0027DBAFEF|nr:tetratricopeptide repeat protein [Streptomyces adelaidensis]
MSTAWRRPLGGLVAAGVGALFVPMGGTLWIHLCVTLGAVVVLVRMASREVPFPVAAAQWRLGGDEPAVLRARALSAAACLQQGQPGLAVFRRNAVLPDLVRVQGADHPDTLSSRCLSLQIRGESGDLPDRLTAMADLTADLTRVLGPGHPDTLAARYSHAEWLNQDGRTDEAEAAYVDLVTMATEHVGADHNVTLIARSSLAILRHDRAGGTVAAADEAVADMTAVVDAMERVLGPDDPTTSSTRRLLAQWTTTRRDPTP